MSTSIEETLKSVLDSVAGVFPLVKPKGESFPAIVYQRISTNKFNTHSNKVNLYRVNMQVACMDETYKKAKELAESVNDLLDLNTTDFEICYLQNWIESKPDSSEPYIIYLTYYIWSIES
jgi:hypothetical protein